MEDRIRRTEELLGIPVVTVAVHDGRTRAEEQHEQHVRVSAYDAGAVGALRNRIEEMFGPGMKVKNIYVDFECTSLPQLVAKGGFFDAVGETDLLTIPHAKHATTEGLVHIVVTSELKQELTARGYETYQSAVVDHAYAQACHGVHSELGTLGVRPPVSLEATTDIGANTPERRILRAPSVHNCGGQALKLYLDILTGTVGCDCCVPEKHVQDNWETMEIYASYPALCERLKLIERGVPGCKPAEAPEGEDAAQEAQPSSEGPESSEHGQLLKPSGTVISMDRKLERLVAGLSQSYVKALHEGWDVVPRRERDSNGQCGGHALLRCVQPYYNLNPDTWLHPTLQATT